MKLSKNTMLLLKNFSTINSNLFVKAGSTLSTMSIQKNIMAEVEVPEKFPVDFGIFNLSQLLSSLNELDDPEITFGKTNVELAKSGIKYKITFASPNILVYPQKAITMPAVDVSFMLTAAQLISIAKAGANLGIQDVMISGDGKNVTVSMGDRKDATSNGFTLETGAETKETFNLIIKNDNLKMIEDDYTVEISKKNIGRFVGKNNKVTYFIALEDCQFS